MRKPIFVMTIAYRGAPNEDIKRHFSEIKKQLSDDYHVMVIVDGSIDESKYQMFSDREIEPIELEKLKEIVNGN